MFILRAFFMSQIIHKYDKINKYGKLYSENQCNISLVITLANFNHFGIYLLILNQFSPAFKLF